MQLGQIQAFLAVAELESFSLAAERLHLTQPAVSKRIRQLEQSVEVTLFDRIGKRSTLTPNGQAFRPHAERIVQELETYRSGISHQLDTPSGSLSLATSHHIGLHRLPRVLRRFKMTYPQVDLDIRFMDSEEACQGVADNELELAVVTLPETPDPRIDCEPVWIDQLVAVLANDHPLAAETEIEPASLLEHAAILPSLGTFTRRIINKLFAEHKDRLRITLETNYLETIKVMVSANLGWSILPRSMIDNSLVGRPLRGFDVERRLGIVTLRNRTLSLGSSTMIDLLRDARVNAGGRGSGLQS